MNAPDAKTVETVPFSVLGRALVDEIMYRHRLEMHAALDKVGADVGCFPSGGWTPNVQNGTFTRPSAPANEPPRVVAPPATENPT